MFASLKFANTALAAAAVAGAFFVSASAQAPLITLAKRGGVDTDGDGRGEIIIRNGQGASQIGRFNTTSNQFVWTNLTDPGTSFRHVGLVDLNGNGKTDLVYQNVTQGEFGEVAIWPDFIAGNTQQTLRSVKRTWDVQAVGDLDGDGFGDFVWRYVVSESPDTGVSYIWFTNGSAVTQVRKRGGAPLSWKLVGAADLNSDGAADMGYVSPDNQIRVLMATPNRTCANLSAGSVPTGFLALKLADFSGRGRGDLLVRNGSSGEMRLISLNASGLALPPYTGAPDDQNASCTSSTLVIPTTLTTLPTSDPSWSFYAADDFDGDGIFDIVWQRPDGTLVMWKMNGSVQPTVFANVGTAPAKTVASAPAAPTTTDVRVGDPNANYFSVEISPSMKYFSWQEPSANGPSVWMCGIDPDTADFTPADCRGFQVPNTPITGAQQWGIDATGEFFVTVDRLGRLLQVRPINATIATVTVLPIPANTTRQYPYPSRIANRQSAYLLYIQQDAQGRQQLWMADLAQAGAEQQLTSGPVDFYFSTPSFLATIYRWFPGLPQFSYGFNGANGKLQMKVVDLASGVPVTSIVTNDSFDHVDDFSTVIDGVPHLVGGVNGTTQGALYRRDATTGQFNTVRTFQPVGTDFRNAKFAASIEPLTWKGKTYATFLILDGGGLPGSFPAEIWLTSLSDSTVLKRISSDDTINRLDPEYFLGNTRAWAFYYGKRPGSTISELHRVELGLP